MEKKSKELKVAALCNGTVIDHLPPRSLFTIAQLLELERHPHQVTLGFNLPSKSMGLKGLIKISDRHFHSEELGVVALFAPQATVNTVEDYRVTGKQRLALPQQISRILACPNPNCITNNQKVATRFAVRRSEAGTRLRCHWCERELSQEEIRLK